MSAEKFEYGKEPEAIALVALKRLEMFVDSRMGAEPVTSYEELQAVLHGGQRTVPELIARYVWARGKARADREGQDAYYFKGKTDRYLIQASFEKPDSQQRAAARIIASRRMLPLMRYKETKLVTLHLTDLTFDQAIVYRPRQEDYFPSHASPETAEFFLSTGDRPNYGGEDGSPTWTTAQMVREATAGAYDTFNGFLDTAVWLVDQLTKAHIIES